MRKGSGPLVKLGGRHGGVPEVAENRLGGVENRGFLGEERRRALNLLRKKRAALLADSHDIRSDGIGLSNRLENGTARVRG